jgi:isochorismate synthase
MEPGLKGALWTTAARRGALHATEDLVVCALGESRRIAMPGGLADAAAPSVVAGALEAIALEGDDGPGGSGVLAVGSLPFDRTAPASLVVPSLVVAWAPGAPGGWATEIGPDLTSRVPAAALGAWAALGASPGPLPRLVELVEQQPGEDYAAAVADAVARLHDGQLDKVVLARSVRGQCDGPIDTAALTAFLHGADPSCALYAVSLGDRRYVGASPELIVATSGGAVSAHPLAGTVALDGTDDEAAVAWLLGSAKNRHEHALVVNDILERLAGLCESLSASEAPTAVRLSTDARLGTWIDGKLRGEPSARTAMAALAALHPTPAVGGVPRAAALELIAALEVGDRGPWTGPVGWVDADGSSTWTLGLRGILVGRSGFEAWAGAGIVADSVPADELVETEVKLGSVLRAFPR